LRALFWSIAARRQAQQAERQQNRETELAHGKPQFCPTATRTGTVCFERAAPQASRFHESTGILVRKALPVAA
jgi:hypothetical protein